MALMDRHVVIAGGAGGIGAALCSSCIREGARILVSDRLDMDSFRFGCDSLEEADHGQVTYRECDITRPGQVRELAGAADSFLGGRIDVLVNCVGVNVRDSLLDLAEEDWDRCMDVNFKGSFLLFSALAPMVRSGGAIVFLSGASSPRPQAAGAAYALSKMALNRLTVLMAAEVAERGVRVNAVCPGPVMSGRVMDEQMIDPIAAGHRTAEQAKEEMLSKMPLARRYAVIPPVQSVVDAVNFLISDEARFITGAVLPVDGGRSLA